ncbi:MAG: hypothetical protein HY302_09440 [Opitutae bacterium]|nr:hypothetical protein [Opitutae bacterium]
MNALPQRPPPKPWPMKWIVAVIVVFIAGYTWVNLRYRKPGRAFRPYQDMNDRATTVRLLQGGWSRLPVTTRRPADKPAGDETPAAAADISRGSAGLGPELARDFAEKPKLPASIDRVVAPAAVAHGADYAAYFTVGFADNSALLGDLALYRKGNLLVLLPTLEPVPGKLLVRWKDGAYWVTFPTRSLSPGSYQVRLLAQGPAAVWNVTVR